MKRKHALAIAAVGIAGTAAIRLHEMTIESGAVGFLSSLGVLLAAGVFMAAIVAVLPKP